MGFFHQFNSNYRVDEVICLIQGTSKQYKYLPEVTARSRVFHVVRGSYFELICYPEIRERYERFHDVHFQGVIKPTKEGSVIIGTFYAGKGFNSYYLLVSIGILCMLFFGFPLSIALCSFAGALILSIILNLPDPALQEYVCNYIRDNLLNRSEQSY